MDKSIGFGIVCMAQRAGYRCIFNVGAGYPISCDLSYKLFFASEIAYILMVIEVNLRNGKVIIFPAYLNTDYLHTILNVNFCPKLQNNNLYFRHILILAPKLQDILEYFTLKSIK